MSSKMDEILKTLDQILKRLEMVETATFGTAQEKGTSTKYNNKKKAKATKPKSITIPQDIESLSHSEVVELAKHVFAKHYTPEDLAKISLQIQKEDLISAAVLFLLFVSASTIIAIPSGP